jgi:2-polyprenyl-3-methyl-5-hydroxy-6-metoxy-1,4-benzoquinol methylase
MGCPICKKKKNSFSLQIRDYEYNLGILSEYNQCKNCESIYRKYPKKLKKELEIKSYNKNNYLPLKGNKIYNLLKKINAKYEIKKIKKCLDVNFFNKKKTILDIACGNGYLIREFAKNKNCKCHGIDAYISTQKKNNVRFIKSSFENFKLIKKINPDLIIINNFIEHIEDLNKIKNFIRLMKKNSYLIIITPNANSLARKVFSKYWSGYHAPRHKIIFSAKSINDFISKNKKIVFEQNILIDPFSNIISISNIVKKISFISFIPDVFKLFYFLLFSIFVSFENNRIFLKVKKI